MWGEAIPDIGFPSSWIAPVFALASIGFLPIITLQCRTLNVFGKFFLIVWLINLLLSSKIFSDVVKYFF